MKKEIKTRKQENKRNKGITLIALVITIVVLLILAGITINLTIGEDGIITRAQEAGKTYKNAETNELAYLNDFEASVIPGKVAKTVDGVQYVGDGMGNLIPVPVGFSYLEGTKNTGFVIKNDEDNNEFVWIPVDDTTPYSYDRVAFSKEGWAATQTKGDYDDASQSYKIIREDYSNNYTETMPTIAENRTELDSVTEYKGFYIGRYEVGVIGGTLDISTMINDSAPSENWTGYSNGTAVVQKGKQVWNFITRDKAKEVAEGMYSNLENVTSRLCSSYAWDTALKFIDTKNPGYSTNSTGENYKDTTFTYIDLYGNTQTKAENTQTLVPTGQTTAVNNIYDMGGNVNEWATEAYTRNLPCTYRGGYFAQSSGVTPAAHRTCNTTTHAHDFVGFRSTLYL